MAEQNNSLQTQTKSTASALNTMQDAASMVLSYAKRIVGDERAQEFYTHVSIMMQQNPKIKECSPVSVVQGMMACVRLNLMPNTPQQYAHLIPYGKDLQFQLGYKGLVKLANNAGVGKISAELVFPEDEFKIEMGTQRKLTHEITIEGLSRDRTNAADAVFIYATAKLPDGEEAFEVMTQSDVLKIKDKAVKATGNGTPWKEWESEQYKKTVVKRFTKLLPQSDTDERLNFATQIDSLAEANKLRLDIETGDIIEGEVAEKTDNRTRIEAAKAKRAAMDDTNFKPKAVATHE